MASSRNAGVLTLRSRAPHQAGDHVRVGAGQHEGQTGMVVRVEDPVSILLCDATREELRVFTRDLSESAAAAPGLDTCARDPRVCVRAWVYAPCVNCKSQHLPEH